MKAFLLASLEYSENTLVFKHLGIYSESTRQITWNYGRGVPAEIMSAEGKDFSEARFALLAVLKKYHPKLYSTLKTER